MEQEENASSMSGLQISQCCHELLGEKAFRDELNCKFKIWDCNLVYLMYCHFNI